MANRTRPSTRICGMIYEQIRSRPEAIAMRSLHREFTYGGLGTLANRIRQQFDIVGLKRGDIVALYLPPSPEFVASALATMSAGAAYLPVDLSYPEERLSFMVADSGARLLITMSQLCPSIHVPEAIPVIEVDRSQPGEDDGWRHLSPPTDVGSDELAYVIYTSGSTGKPKGVEITHGGLSNLIDWHNRTFQISNRDRVSQIANLSYDASVWEIWPNLVSGATLCTPNHFVRQDPPQLQQWLVTEGITVAFVPTVLAERISQMTWPAEATMRFLLTGGEPLRAYPDKGLPFTLVNNYGPTECTVVTTSGTVSADGDHLSLPSIGRPIANAQVYILDEKLRLVRPGQIGELCIGGPSLARGYHNLPELTAEKFIPNPFVSVRGARLYRTGDLAKLQDDGQIQFLGRRDDQVKIRGHRIELNEVARVISRNQAVCQCVVVARGSDDDEKQLVAYIVPTDGMPSSPAEIRESVRKILPDYMIPSRFVCVKEFPLTAHGKIDQSALPPPGRESTVGLAALVLPRTDMERQIAAIVRTLLKLEEIGVEDNFFLLGGHSLFGAQLIGRLRERFNVEVPLRALFDMPTIGSLAGYIGRAVSDASKPAAD